jgi:lysophospholipase L1-like esterase
LYGVNFKTNSLGFRADREFITPNTDNITRILVLGDSITVGWGVKVNESYPARLQTMLNKVGNYEVINTGVGNYNTKRELATLQKHIDLEPDIIILGFFINDIEEVGYCKNFCWIQKNSYTYAFVYDRFVKLKYGSQNSFKNYYSELYKDESLKNSLTNDIRTIYEIANNESAKLVLVNIPELHEFEEYPFTEVNEFIEQDIITDLNITYINLLPSFSNHSPNDLWVSFEDAHPNAKGHQIIAKKIFKEVFENG